MAARKGFVDGLPAEDTGLVAGFPFGVNECLREVPSQHRSCSPSHAGAHLVWIACAPLAVSFADFISVSLVVVAVLFEDVRPVGFAVSFAVGLA